MGNSNQAAFMKSHSRTETAERGSTQGSHNIRLMFLVATLIANSVVVHNVDQCIFE